MTLDAFGAQAGPLLVAGALGGLARGLLALRKAYAAGPVTKAALVAIGVDMGTAIALGSLVSLFLSGAVSTVLGPGLDLIHVDPGAKDTTSGFLAGIGAISILGFITDTFAARAKLKQDAPPQGGTPP